MQAYLGCPVTWLSEFRYFGLAIYTCSPCEIVDLFNGPIQLASMLSHFRPHDHSLEHYFVYFFWTLEKIHWYRNTLKKRNINKWFEMKQHWAKVNGSISWTYPMQPQTREHKYVPFHHGSRGWTEQDSHAELSNGTFCFWITVTFLLFIIYSKYVVHVETLNAPHHDKISCYHGNNPIRFSRTSCLSAYLFYFKHLAKKALFPVTNKHDHTHE
jgi:hypothetical protein